MKDHFHIVEMELIGGRQLKQGDKNESEAIYFYSYVGFIIWWNTYSIGNLCYIYCCR